MERILLDTDYGLLSIRYPTNEWKKKRLEPLNLSWNSARERFETSSSKVVSVIDHIKKMGAYVQLSPTLQDITGLDIHGLTEHEESVDLEKWADHHSFAESPTDKFDKKLAGFKDESLPFMFQYAGMEIAQKYGGRVLVADQMGLGKTLIICGIIGLFRENLPAVIVAPKSVQYNWKSEILRFLDFIDESDITILGSENPNPSQLISICTYRYAVENKERLKQYMNVNGILAFDEAHTGKEKDSQIGECMIELAHFAKCYIPLTGTPIINFVYELYALLHGLDPIRWNDYHAFTERYCEGHWVTVRRKGRKYTEWYDKGASFLEELMEIIRSNYMIRRLRSDVLKQLPKLSRLVTTLNPTESDRQINSLFEHLKKLARPTLIKNKLSIQNSIDTLCNTVREEELVKKNTGKKQSVFELYERLGKEKVSDVVECVINTITTNPDSKFIFFFQHKSVLELMKSALQAKYEEFSDITITGDVSAKKREEEKNKFQTTPSCRFAYLTIGAGYAAITLTKANKVGMVQMPWGSEVALQCEARALRIGQERDVDALYYRSANVFDTNQYQRMLKKSDTATTAIDGVRGEKFEGSNENDEIDTTNFMTTIASMALIDVKAEIESEAL